MPHHYAVQHAADLMPEFDPQGVAVKTRSAKAFIDRVKALRAHYGWTEFVVLEAVQQKLRGQSKEWLDESPHVYTAFDQFEGELLHAYPSYTTRVDMLEEVMSQKRALHEGLDEFCRRMVSLGRRSDVPEDDMAQIILKRINHAQFTMSVGCLQVDTVSDLLRAVAYFNKKT